MTETTADPRYLTSVPAQIERLPSSVIEAIFAYERAVAGMVSTVNAKRAGQPWRLCDLKRVSEESMVMRFRIFDVARDAGVPGGYLNRVLDLRESGEE